MPSTFPIYNYLQVFERFFGTVDVRAALVQKNGHEWCLVALSIYVRLAPTSASEQEFASAVGRLGRINSSVFQLVQRCYSISESERFFGHLALGKLVMGDISVNLSAPCDVRSFLAHLQVDTLGLGTNSWPRIGFQRQLVNDAQVRKLLLSDPDLLRDTEMAGYEYPHVAVSSLLGIDFSQSSDTGYVWLTCDLPVRLLTPEVKKSGDQFQLRLRALSHAALEDLSCTVRRVERRGQKVIQQSVVELRRNSNADTGSWSGELQLPFEREDQVTLDVLYSKVGRLYSVGVRPFDLLSLEERSPLIATLNLFCGPEQLRTLVQEPTKAKIELSTSNVARVFEVSVQWLLSFLGFRAIWLHAYEKLKEEKIQLGTVDCLAFKEDEQLLLLVNCSIAAPDPGEINRQENLAKRIEDQLFSSSKVDLRSVLFTLAHKPRGEQQSTHGSAVKVVYKEDIEALLQLVERGDHFEYSRWSNPLFS